MDMIDSHSRLVEMLCERNAFEITDFGQSDYCTGFVQLESKATHVIVKIDWRAFKVEEYEVRPGEGSSQADRIERLRVPVDQEKLKKLPRLLKSAVDTIGRDAVPVQACITDNSGQIRFRDLTSFTGGMGQHLFGVVRIQINWAFGIAIVEIPDDKAVAA